MKLLSVILVALAILLITMFHVTLFWNVIFAAIILLYAGHVLFHASTVKAPAH
ncbi:hypothetical protein [Periweissella cryptocerci]|uniref:hypothetical protein n=1 Tax=Periweissella cryptocerci TaxID=2506420 RepID=UPI0014045A82|nr:hypothetical protein [Periweissella cryptocerci]